MISKNINWQYPAQKLRLTSYKHLTRASKGATTLFFVKLFLVIPYGAIYSSLLLYMTRQLQMIDTVAASMVAASLAYMAVARVFMGWIGGRYIDFITLLYVCIFLMIAGCALICFSSTFYWGICAIIFSSGSMVAVNCLLAQLYQEKCDHREAAFIWNYTGIQIGNVIGYLLGGYVQLHYHYQALFLLAVLSSLIALLIVYINKDTFVDGVQTDKSHLVAIFAALILGCYLLSWLLQHSNIGASLVLGCSIALFAYLYMQSRCQPCDKMRMQMTVYLFLAVPTVLFWSFNYMTPVVMSLFIDRHVDRQLFSYVISPQWIQMISGLTIVIGGPLLCIQLNKLKNYESLAIYLRQCVIAFFIAALSVGMLCAGFIFTKHTGMVSINWVFISYLLQGIAELLIAPVGYAMVAYLAPHKLHGLMMSGWIGLMSVGAVIAGFLSQHLLVGNASFLHQFIAMGLLMLLAMLVVAGLAKKINGCWALKAKPNLHPNHNDGGMSVGWAALQPNTTIEASLQGRLDLCKKYAKIGDIK